MYIIIYVYITYLLYIYKYISYISSYHKYISYIYIYKNQYMFSTINKIIEGPGTNFLSPSLSRKTI